MSQLTRIDLRGFKTIKSLEDFALGGLNVLIGANGAGKSNFLSFFRMVHWMWTPPGQLQYFVGKHGGASSLLHDGPAATPNLDARLRFEGETGTTEYAFRLSHAAGDTLVFADEEYGFWPQDGGQKVSGETFRGGHRESILLELTEPVPSNGRLQGPAPVQESEGRSGEVERVFAAVRALMELLRGCVVYQFHNTSETARVRQRWAVDDNHALKEDGANLAPFLFRLRQESPLAYRRIVETLRQIVPFFADFVLEPSANTLLLQWRERGTDLVFGPHQASDGTLRTMALVALLLQPVEDVPGVVLLDEPELGLHPFAVTVLAGLIKSLSLYRQIVLATQSTPLLDHFDPQDVVVVDRTDRVSTFRRLDPVALADWLEEYSLGELWEKNVLGGRPGR